MFDWLVFSDSGPKFAFHTAAVINGDLYIHGGIDTAGSTRPLNSLFKLSLTTGVWTDITTSQSPNLSHHCCVVIGERYLTLIGGWNGKARVSDVWVYDSLHSKWNRCDCSGFPAGAGLSSHCAILLTSGRILVVGREGSLRTQRRSGNSFLLRGDCTTGVFSYSDSTLGVASRSGHTLTPVGTQLIVIGGRNDRFLERHANLNPVQPPSDLMVNYFTDPGGFKQLVKAPSGRKYHSCVPVRGGLFLYGGETFDGRSRAPVGHMFLIKLKPNLTMYEIGTSVIGRAGHVMFVYGMDIYIHGGVGARNMVTRETLKLSNKT